MDILLDPAAAEPIYRQIFSQLQAQILRGALPPGQALPPIRTVSRELAISVITVKRAWEELEQAGLIVTQAGSGCYVAALPNPEREQSRRELARACLAPAVDYCLSLGLSRQEIGALVLEAADTPTE